MDAKTTTTVELDEDARLWLWHGVFGQRADALLHSLADELPWQQPHLTLYGREHPIRRLQCWMGDDHAQYRYSGLLLEPVPWHKAVSGIRDKVTALCGHSFNAVLINQYRDGNDRMGWHSDDEPELGAQPWIASYNLGAKRAFAFRRRGQTRTGHTLELAHDQLLLMSPGVQHGWQHAVPVRQRIHDRRINLTFRHIVENR